MRLLVLILAVFGAAFSTGAQAQAECTAIPSDTERLACYDRLHGMARATASPLPANNLFAGAYLGASFSAGKSTKVSASSLRSEGMYDGFRKDTPTLGGFVGYNTFSGDTLFGVELDVKADLGKIEREYSWGVSDTEYPRAFHWGSGSYTQPAGTIEYRQREGGAARYATKHLYEFKETIAPTLSIRLGHRMNNWLLYGRAGAGASYIEEAFIGDDSDSIRCEATSIESHYPGGGRITEYETGCINPYAGDVTVESKSKWRPTATLAIGAEYTFDRYFARVEAEARHLFLNERLDFSETEGLTRYQLGAGIGLRF